VECSVFHYPLREVIPLTKQKVSVRVPRGRRVPRVHLLVAGVDARIRTKVEGFAQSASVNPLEVVVIDLA